MRVGGALSVLGWTVSCGLAAHPQTPFTLKENTSPPVDGKIITPQFKELVEEIRLAYKVPGLTLGVLRDGHEPEYGAWGNSSEAGDLMEHDKLFFIGSCTKAFTATAFALLMEDYAAARNVTPLPSGLDAFTWKTKVQDMLPGAWQLQDKWATEKADFQDILSHMSGLAGHDIAYAPEDSASDVVYKMRHLSMGGELREQWDYNNLMWQAATTIISRHSKKTFAAFAKERIFDPLNMTSTTLTPSEAEPYMSQAWDNEGRRIPLWFTDENVDSIAGAGGIASNVVDMGKWIDMWINGGFDKPSNKTIISPDTYDQLTTAHAVAFGKPGPVGYGQGFLIDSLPGYERVWHTGGLPGFTTFLGFTPGDKAGVICFTNTPSTAMAVVGMLAMNTAHGLSHQSGLDIITAFDPLTQKLLLARERRTRATSDLLSASANFFEAFSGTYNHPGYGTLTVCGPPGSIVDDYCTQVLADFSAVDHASSTPRDPKTQLVAAFSRIWSSHVRLEYSTGTTFNVELPALFPAGYGADKTPFETSMGVQGEARFHRSEGSGGLPRILGFSVTGIGGRPDGANAGAVWFDKVT